MKKRILYLHGARASAKALPIVKGLVIAFKGLAIRITNEHPHEGFSGNFVKQIHDNLLWLQEQSRDHVTIVKPL